MLKDPSDFEQKNPLYIHRRRRQKLKWHRKSRKEWKLNCTGTSDLTCCVGQCRPSSTDLTHLPSPTPSVTTPLSTSSSSPSSTLDTPVLQSFTISTKTNVEYNHINQLLHTVHVNRYGDPELHEGWWQDSSTNNEIDYMDMDPTNTYQDINTTLRQAFLQRHHHPWYDIPTPYITLSSSICTNSLACPHFVSFFIFMYNTFDLAAACIHQGLVCVNEINLGTKSAWFIVWRLQYQTSTWSACLQRLIVEQRENMW